MAVERIEEEGGAQMNGRQVLGPIRHERRRPDELGRWLPARAVPRRFNDGVLRVQRRLNFDGIVVNNNNADEVFPPIPPLVRQIAHQGRRDDEEEDDDLFDIVHE